MAGSNKRVRDTNWHWTNKRHLHFLNSIEASFVRTMFQTSDRYPPLDRYLPDTWDSTEDLGKERRRKLPDSGGTSMNKKTTKSSHVFSQDQVVPQKKGDDKDKR